MYMYGLELTNFSINILAVSAAGKMDILVNEVLYRTPKTPFYVSDLDGNMYHKIAHQ